MSLPNLCFRANLQTKAAQLPTFALLLTLVLALATGCSDTQTAAAPQATSPRTQTLVIDTHIDAPFRLHRAYTDLSQPAPDREFDYPRAKAGGLNGAFMSIYIPAAVDAAGDGVALADKLIDDMEALAQAHPDKFAIATCAADIAAQAQRGLVSLPLGMENGGPVAASADTLEHFYRRGIRYITLTHSQSNALSDSSYDPNEVLGGLSPLGQDMVGRMNKLGIMIDVSHISDRAFDQVMALSQAPVIASHSSLRHFVPGFHRNMSDEMVKMLGAAGGVIQINFGSSFVSAEARTYSDTAREVFSRYQQEQGLEWNAPAMVAFREQYRADNPYPFATMETVLDHFDRAIELAGIDAVGIGSDYDGVGDTLPEGLKDVSTYGALMDGLAQRGYSQQDIDKIMGGNLLRVWREVEAFASAQGNPVACSG
jgi:membrane dipeptidase